MRLLDSLGMTKIQSLYVEPTGLSSMKVSVSRSDFRRLFTGGGLWKELSHTSDYSDKLMPLHSDDDKWCGEIVTGL